MPEQSDYALDERLSALGRLIYEENPYNTDITKLDLNEIRRGGVASDKSVWSGATVGDLPPAGLPFHCPQRDKRGTTTEEQYSMPHQMDAGSTPGEKYQSTMLSSASDGTRPYNVIKTVELAYAPNSDGRVHHIIVMYTGDSSAGSE